jgi:dimeric dUTPase (all-alpha-NTP-PPase superfamily)
MHDLYENCGYGCGVHDYYDDLFGNFINLGKLLGFTWDQVEKAYFEKNAINHQRQESGY